MLRRPRRLGLAAACLALLAGALAGRAEGQPEPTVGDYTLVGSARITRTVSEFTYTARLTNPLAGALSGVRASLTSLSPATVVVDGSLDFGDVPPGATVGSLDTFTIRQDRTVLFDPADLVWTVTFAEANRPPTAIAGLDRTVTVGTLVQLDGSGSTDPDGDSLTFRWRLTAVPPDSAAALSDVTALRPTFLVDRAGAYVAELVVNDGRVDGAADAVLISTLNSRPVGDAGPDRTVPVGATVVLDGRGADVDGDPLTFRWRFVERPPGSAADLTDPTAPGPAFIADVAGRYVLELIVGDGALESVPDRVQIDTVNSPPVADAGPDQTATAGVAVTLDGRASTDADGDALTWRWSFTTRPDGSAAGFQDPTAPQATFVPDVDGTYVAQLIVNDGLVDSAADTAVITAHPANQAPIADGGPDQTVARGATVRLDGGASSDPEGAALTFAWTLLSRPQGSGATLAGATTATPAFVADVNGTYVVRLVVNDGTADSAADTVTVTVLDGADLRIFFEIAPPAAPPVGSVMSMLIRLDNLGPASATGVIARVQVPAGLTITSSTALGVGTFDPATGLWTVDTLTAANFTRLSLGVRVDAPGPADLTLAITASGVPDPNPGNNTTSARITPNPNADLTVFFEVGPPATPPVGSEIGTLVRLDNLGPASAAGVVARVQVPAGLTIVRFDTLGGGTFDPTTGLWTVGALSAAQFSRLSLALKVSPAGPYDLTATIVGHHQPDPNPANDTAVAAITPNPNADLSIEFFNPPSGNLEIGRLVSLFVEVRNVGPASTTGVKARFAVPPGYTITGGGPQVGTYDAATGDWTIGAMTGSGLARLIFNARVNATGSVALVATMTGSDQPDPNPANNTAAPPLINRPPAADAGADQDVATGARVQLDGRGAGDPDGDAITFEWAFALRPASSAAVLQGADTATPSFTADLPGTYTITLTVRDHLGIASAADPVTVRATGASRAPVVFSEPVTTAAVGQPYRYAVGAFDPDDGALLAFSLTTAPAGMAIAPATGVIDWTPADGQGGSQSVVVRVQDERGLFTEQSFAVQVSSAANRAPVAVDDAYEVRLGEALSVAAPGVLGNDGDADGQPLRATLITLPGNGTVRLEADGSFVYTPHAFRAGDLVTLQNVNLATRVPGVVVQTNASSFGSASAFAADDDLGTSWRSPFAVAPFAEIRFPADVTVAELQIFGHRDPFLAAGDHRARAGFFQLFDAHDAELFNSGVVELPLPDRDARQTVPSVAGVRRARFTITAFNEAGFADFKVIGSAVIRRAAAAVEPNLGQLLPTTARASSVASVNLAEAVIDDNVATNWYAASFAAGEFLELEFPVDVTVTEIFTRNPSARPDGFGTSAGIDCSGSFTLLAGDGTVLFDSGVVNEPFGAISSGDTFTLPVPGIAGIRTARYTSAGCRATSFTPPGFAEIRVTGTAAVDMPAFAMARKFHALVGREAHSTPMVINLTDDNHDGVIDTRDVPDIVVPVESTNNQLTGEIKVVSGDDGRELLTIGGPNLVSPWSELAVGDIDGDGLPDIVAVHSDGNHLIAFDHTGAPKWLSDANPMPRFFLGSSALIGGAVALANLDAGGPPEIVVGASVFDAQGRLLGDGRTLGGTTGGSGLRSAISAVADLDLDGLPELVAGPTAYRLVNGALNIVWRRTDRPDGYVAVGNFDDDPFPEIVVVANGQVYMLNHDGTDAEIWNPPTHAPVALPGGGQGGAPTVADLDADGVPEIGVAGATNYVVFRRDGSVRWKSAVSDRSSNSTGATVFDFDGDGSVEVVYRDEQFLRVYRGADGVLLARLRIGSATWSEQPVVVDVDNDGHAEIVVSSDRLGSAGVGDTGIHVLEDVADLWARTRRIWNQHSYHVTNVDEHGAIPPVETPNWLVPGLNHFRLNAFLPGESPDLADAFTYRASDGALASETATVRIAVRPQNAAPRITSSPVTSASPAVPYRYAALATDPDGGDILTFSLATAPAGMTIDPASGLIQWTPTAAQLGRHDVVVRVRDVRGLYALQPYAIQVAAAVTVPDVLGQPESAARSAIVAAGLAAGATTTRHSAGVAAGAVMSQQPPAGTLAAPGTAVTLVVSLGPPPVGTVPDVVGLTQPGAETDIVAAGFVRGAVTSRHDAQAALGVVLAQAPPAGAPAPSGSAVDLVVSLGRPPGERDLDGDGVTGNEGDCDDTSASIQPGAADVAGNGIDENCNGRDSIAGDDTPPVSRIDAPSETDVLRLPTDIRGVAEDDNFLRYVVDVTPVNGGGVTRLASGTTPVTGVLGRLDPTLLENGLYRVRLVVEDVNGNLAVDERVVQVNGVKVGHARLSFIDLQVPLAGIPISVVRTYDSRVTEARDFGVGWSLGVRQGAYQNNREPGRGWQIVESAGPLGLPCQVVRETLFHVTQIWLSDREFYTFRLALQNPAPVVGGCVAEARFVFLDGSTPGATLEALGGTEVLYTSGDDVRGFDGGEDTGVVYSPRAVRLRTRDRRVLDLDVAAGITRIQDAHGNTLTIDAAGVAHSSGKSIAFERDARGRITRIVDPSGDSLRYTYDAVGDLATVVSRTGTVVTHRYDDAHRLQAIVDGLGQVLFRAEYDTEGRLRVTEDAEGHRIGMTHDLAARRSTLVDRTGATTVYEFDERGNIVRHTDGGGHEMTFTYGAFDTLLATVDALGNSTVSTYDDQGNLLTRRDPLGHATSYTYDASGQVLSATDALGRTITHTYDARGNRLSTTDADGHVRRYAYDAQGNLIRKTDPAGNIWTFAYDVFGRLASETTPCGGDIRYEYDAVGRRVRMLVARTLPSGARETIVTRYTNDAEGRPIRTTFHDGGSVIREFDAAGNVRATVDRLGRRTTYAYTPTGRLSAVTYPDGGAVTYAHDAEGRLTGVTDPDGRTIAHVHDARGQRVRTIGPDGGATVTSHDEAGRVIAETDALGRTTTHAYDAAGRRTSTTDASGRITRFTYDAVGNLTSVTDANGHVTAYAYDAHDRRTKVVHPDGTTTLFTYDFASRVTSTTDQAGLVTRYTYDACGRLASVTDALGRTTSYTYDEMGHRLSQTDPAGRVTAWEYDAFHRVTRRTLPLGMSETFAYDAAGNVIARTDFSGRTIDYAYDAADRLATKRFPGGAAVTFTYSPGGQRLSATDARGVTEYRYDTVGQLAAVLHPDGTQISYAYDAVGNRTAVTVPSGTTTYGYDAMDRLTAVTEPDGARTGYRYDAVGNLVGVDYPSGLRAERTYDALDRPVRLEHRAPDDSLVSAFAYTLGPIGHRLQVAEHDGRTVSYAYDALYRLVEERITGPGAGERTIAYTYDAAGNRLTRDDSVEGLTVYAYDANDRLLSENGGLYTYDADGNLLTRPDGSQYRYDAEHRLIEAETPAGLLAYGYDADGVRVRSVAAGVVTTYLVDTNRPFAEVLEERDGTGALVADNVFGHALIRRRQAASRAYYHHDAQRSVRHLSDPGGLVADRYTYDAFGVLLDHAGSSTNPYLFAGEQLDGRLGQYYLRARYYDPRLGRFSTMDPVAAVPTEPRSLHRYAYAFNDPVNRRDPSGGFGLAEAMISVSISGVLAQLAQPGVAGEGVPILHVDASSVAGHQDPTTRYQNIGGVVAGAIGTTRANFQQYNVKILAWHSVNAMTSVAEAGGPSPKSVEGKVKVKVMEVVPYAYNTASDCDVEGWLGCAPVNGLRGWAFLQDLLNAIPPSAIPRRSRGNLTGAMGVLLGATISHEAGHLYGIEHPPARAGIMGPGLNPASPPGSWDGPSQKVLKDFLGLKP